MLEHPLPDGIDTASLRVLVVPASGDVLELDNPLIRVIDGVLEADYLADLGAFDVRVRPERTGHTAH